MLKILMQLAKILPAIAIIVTIIKDMVVYVWCAWNKRGDCDVEEPEEDADGGMDNLPEREGVQADDQPANQDSSSYPPENSQGND